MNEAAHDLHRRNLTAPKPQPISLDDIAIQDFSGEDIILHAIKDVKNVNALTEDQTLEFGESGITTVYGDNASGKTGYVRILKLVCRARGEKPPVLRNIFQDPLSENQNQSAIILFKVGDRDRPEKFLWEEDKHSNHLGAISVFDSKCAVQYVERPNDVAFRPFGLDVLDTLAKTCLKVKEKIDETLSMAPDPRYFSSLKGDTEVGKVISTLSSKTNHKTIEKLADLSKVEEERLKKLRKLVFEMEEEAPQKKIAELRLRIGRLRGFREQIVNFETEFGENYINRRKELYSDTQVAVNAADLASKAFSEKEPLRGVGSETWRELWEAARHYSETEAYRNEEFPFLEEDSRCVLCHQILSKEAKQRMRQFETFVKEETQNKADRLRKTLREEKVSIERITLVSQKISELVSELKVESEECAEKVQLFINDVNNVKSKVLEAFENGDWDSIPTLPSPPEKKLQKIITLLEARITTIESFKEPAKKKELVKELEELKAREKLREVKSEVLEEIENKGIIDKLKKCHSEADTTAISHLSTRLTKKWVDAILLENFEKELKQLGLETIKVQLVLQGSEIGETYHRIEIKGRPEVNIAKIVSEGEHRCISLASFLTELSTATHKSAIILDDPASSLDHLWRDKIAKRLAEEGKKRQVIIFTHDPVFLLMLQENADRLNVPFLIRSIRREHDTTGFCGETPPWYSMGVQKRIRVLNSLHQEAEVTSRKQPEEYEYRARFIYGRLRETWERAIEEILFNSTVLRFRRGIKTNQLRDVDIKQSDYERVDNAMTKCSKFLVGHDDAIEINEPVPEPSEIKKDIEDLNSWIKEIHRRREKQTQPHLTP